MGEGIRDSQMRCPICEGTGEYIGTLGNLDWYRCRNCGMEWSVQATVEELENEDEQETDNG